MKESRPRGARSCTQRGLVKVTLSCTCPDRCQELSAQEPPGVGVGREGLLREGLGPQQGEGAASKSEITWGGGIPCRETQGKERWGLGRIRAQARGGRRRGRGRKPALGVGVWEKGPAYLGFVEQEPHEGGEQQGRGERGSRPQLLGEGRKGGGGGLLGQGHGVRGAHAGEGGAGSAPRLTLAKRARGSTARSHGPDAQAGEAATRHRPRRPAVTATAGRPRAPPPQPPRRARPTAPVPALALRPTGVRAGGWGRATSAQGRGQGSSPAPPTDPASQSLHADPSEAAPLAAHAPPADPPTARLLATPRPLWDPAGQRLRPAVTGDGWDWSAEPRPCLGGVGPRAKLC